MLKRKKSGIILIVLCILLVGIGVILFRLRGSEKIVPDKNYPVAALTTYRQDDPLWATDFLGDSSYTMKSSGCLVTCIAMAISDVEEVMTPRELNRLFSENGVYDADGNIQWGPLEELEGYSVLVYNEAIEEAIADCLEAGHFPIVRVRVSGAGSYHYVLIVGNEDGDYICMDPQEDELMPLSAYGSRIYAVRCVWKDE